MSVKNEVVHGAFLGLVFSVGMFLFLIGFAMGDSIVVFAGTVVAIAACGLLICAIQADEPPAKVDPLKV